MLNEVGERTSTTQVKRASGLDFPHMGVLDFTQDLSLGRAEVGQSRPTGMPIQHG